MIKWDNVHRKFYKLFSNSAPGKFFSTSCILRLQAELQSPLCFHMGVGHPIASPLIYMAGTLPIGPSQQPQKQF